jgi:Uma2 family endonuclease
MATIASSAGTTLDSFTLVQPGERLFTAADLAAMPEQLPSGPVSFELHHGRLVALSPPGATHGHLQNRMGTALAVQGELKGLGRSYTEVAVVLARRPDHVVGADAAFIATRSLPPRVSSEGYLETIPEIVVEIRSKNDTSAEVATKVADYLKAGCALVWVVESEPKVVIEHRRSVEPRTYHVTDALACDDVIPGFRFPLSELFKD